MAISFEEYLESLSRLTVLSDPTLPTPAGVDLRLAASELAKMPVVDRASLAAFVAAHPQWVPVLGLAAGLSQEKLKNALVHAFKTAGWATLAKTRSAELLAMLDERFDVVRLVAQQRHLQYDFGDILVARAGTKVTAAGGKAAGRLLEDAIEGVADQLGLPYELRTRFTGRDNRSAPCDLAIPVGGAGALIVVAAKGFDSTGSKLTDAVGEVRDMAAVRRPTQYVMAAIDGIGWLSRKNDLRKIHTLLTASSIDGMYTLGMLAEFRTDLEAAAERLGLLR